MTEEVILEFLRHCETTKGKHSIGLDGVLSEDDDNPILKGTKDIPEIRLNGIGILEAECCAKRILEKYIKVGKRVLLLRGPQFRVTETEEILLYMLQGEVINQEGIQIWEFGERCFGGIEGQTNHNIKNALLSTGRYTGVGRALTYSDTFDYLEEALSAMDLGIEHKESEKFRDCYRRCYIGLNYAIQNLSDVADVMVITSHRVSGCFTLAASNVLLSIDPSKVEETIANIPIGSQDEQERYVPYKHLRRATFTSVKLTRNSDGTWSSDPMEENYDGHLTELNEKIEKRKLSAEDMHRIVEIREGIADFYESRNMPVHPPG